MRCVVGAAAGGADPGLVALVIGAFGGVEGDEGGVEGEGVLGGGFEGPVATFAGEVGGGVDAGAGESCEFVDEGLAGGTCLDDAAVVEVEAGVRGKVLGEVLPGGGGDGKCLGGDEIGAEGEFAGGAVGEEGEGGDGGVFGDGELDGLVEDGLGGELRAVVGNDDGAVGYGISEGGGVGEGGVDEDDVEGGVGEEDEGFGVFRRRGATDRGTSAG